MGRLIATSCPVNHREIYFEHLHSIGHLDISVKIVVPELSSNALVCFSLCVLLGPIRYSRAWLLNALAGRDLHSSVILLI